MKKLIKLFTMSILLQYTMSSFAQVTLPEVKIIASTYKYLNAVDNKEMAQPVKLLESQVAVYDVKKSEFYSDEYDGYYISFYIPEGRILASYDKDGKLLRTAEKFNNALLPEAVRNAVSQRFPNWVISKDIYQVFYYDQQGKADKTFKLLLENGDKRMRVKLNEKAEFI